MKNLKSFFVLIVACVVGSFLLIYSTKAIGVSEALDQSREKRADIIRISLVEPFGAAERPEVVFYHDLHTDAIEKSNPADGKKDCTVCHLQDKDYLSTKFKRLEDISKRSVTDLYHTECMSCHRETAEAGKKAGPVEVCGECHIEKPGVISGRQPITFDKSLHFRHTEANRDPKTMEGDCSLCHHEYNTVSKKLFYEKGKEGSCRYCHKESKEENRISNRLASHLSCLDCHRKIKAKEQKAGPIKCSGCHAPENQLKIEKVKDVPRMKRNQPDFVLLGAQPENTESKKITITMNPVPFDHRAHEGYNRNCLDCHHASLDSCAKKCHTIEGSEDGKGVKLERAMHQTGSNAGCISCHESKQQVKECAGCHNSISKSSKKDDLSCRACHMKPFSAEIINQKQGQKPGEMKPEVIAEKMLSERTFLTGTYTQEDIPETITIKRLSKEFEPVKFPHRQIINKIMDNIKGNKLAGYFHMDKGTVCQGCHHNSPVSVKPPNCVTCHGKPFDDANIFRPGLKAAYHQQCNGCHEDMKIEKPRPAECADCHKQIGQPKL